MRTRLCLAFALLGLIAAALPLSASAAEYTVVGVCKDPDAGLTLATNPGSEGIVTQETCLSGSGAGAVTISGQGLTMLGGASWTMSVPDDLTIHSLEAQRRFVAKPWDTHFRWEILADGTPVETIVGPTIPADGAVVNTLDAQSVSGRLTCLMTPCPGLGPTATAVGVELKSINARLTDAAPPNVAIMGNLSGPLHGTVDVPFLASDVGGGVTGARLFVDDAGRPPVADPNGGKCTEPFHFLIPCKLELDSTLPFDTTLFPDGLHEIRIRVADAATQETETAPLTIDIHNAPRNTEPPGLTGVAKLGGALTTTSGAWDGDPSSFSYQWLRCPATATVGDQTGCAPISGATGTQYTLAAGDVGKRVVASVTATNQFGPETAFSVPSDLVPDQGSGGGGTGDGGKKGDGGGKGDGGPKGNGGDTTPPVLRGISLSRARFRVGSGATRGTKLKFTSSEASQLSLAITRAGKRKPVASLSRKIAAGRGRLTVSGRIGAKTLRPARYSLIVTAKDAAGNASKPTRLSFTILPG